MNENDWDEVERTVSNLAAKRAMPKALKRSNMGLNGRRVDRELRRMMGELPEPRPRPVQVITEEDFAGPRE